MGKIVFWLVAIFAVLFVIRLLNAAKTNAKRRAQEAAKRAATASAQPMVRCNECQVYLPKAEALPVGDGFHCPPGTCGHRR